MQKHQNLDQRPQASIDRDDRVMGALGSAMPVVMSLMLHAGIFLILLLVTMLAADRAAEPPTRPTVAHVNAMQFDSKRGDMTPDEQPIDVPPPPADRWDEQDDQIQGELEPTSRQTLIASAPGGGKKGLDSRGPNGNGDGRGDARLGDPDPDGAAPDDVVYVIDASGSMTGSIDRVKKQMYLRMSGFIESQMFHVVFFNDDLAGENPSRRLVPATLAARREAADYIASVRAHSRAGTTNPVSALRRAFEVLAKSDGAGDRAQQIHLLTDGQFDVPRKQLMDEIQRLRGKSGVAIYTYLYAWRSSSPDDAESPESVLKAIAEATGGEYTFIPE